MDRSLLARATENSDAPTPGYMYLDIAKNAATNPATCADIAKYLTGRLTAKKNHNIKHKCLKVISKTCASPYLRGQFKRCLAQDPQAMAAIKEALQFRGPPDPVRGDEPFEKVRVAAKEALDAVYIDTPQESSGAPFATSVSSSYGPSSHQQGGYGGGGGGGGGGAPGARQMQGIGNPMYKDPRLEPQPQGMASISINNVMKEAKDTVIGIIKDPLARNVETTVGNQTGNMPRPGGYRGAQYSGPPGRSELMTETNGQWTMASNRGPDAVAPPPNYSNDSAYYKSRDTGNAYAWAQKSGAAAGGVGGSWAAPSVASQARDHSYGHQAAPSISVNMTPGVVTQISGGGGTAVSDGSYEKQLIMELCPPGGMKPEPPLDKLAQFSRSVASLNPDFVCPALLDCLEEGQPWIIRAKALWVIEACVKHGQKPGTGINAYADFFHACHGEIAPLANHSRGAIRDPTKRVLNLLGVATPVAGAARPVAPPPAAAPPAPAPNLLDFGDTVGAAPPAAPPPAPPTAPPAAVGVSLFGGLNFAAAPVPPAGPPPIAPPVPPTSGNLLGDLMSGDAPAPAPIPVAAVSGGSLFGDMNVKPSAAHAPQPAAETANQASSLFDSMSLKTEEPNNVVAATAMPAGGSAFGFMNQTPSTDTTENVPGIHSMDSFDPLKNMTPNTAKQMMQISPEQMQAIAYQQMMMQQQMQMAQMMAMQQQQKRGSGGMFMPMPGNMPGGNMVMQNPAASKSTFAFMDQPQKKDDKSFDFVKDAMTMEKKK